MSEDGEQNGGESDEGSEDKPELKMPDVSPEEALAAFMEVDPEKVREAENREAGSPDEEEDGEVEEG